MRLGCPRVAMPPSNTAGCSACEDAHTATGVVPATDIMLNAVAVLENLPANAHTALSPDVEVAVDGPDPVIDPASSSLSAFVGLLELTSVKPLCWDGIVAVRGS